MGLPPALVFNDNNNIAPRFGFAYRLPGTSSSVIRGGYGLFFQRDIEDKWVESSSTRHSSAAPIPCLT